MKKIKVCLGKNSYDIVICSGNINGLGQYIKQLNIGRDAIIITNSKIKNLYGKKVETSLRLTNISSRFEIVPDSETAKSHKQCLRLLDNISKYDKLPKRLFIIALGGGVIGDLAGFVASIYKRGIPYVQVPTTLLAQVDSAIGGKVAIDLSSGKNLVGAFYQPKLVYTNISFLRTLQRRELISGLAEVMKYGIIISPQLFHYVEKNYRDILAYDLNALQYIVYKCSAIKASIVEKDEKDTKNMRVILNFGHTIGHAIETGEHYSDIYSHGQAVAFGMLAAIFIAEKTGLTDKKVHIRVKKLLSKIGLSVYLKDIHLNAVISAQEHDKKFIHGKNRFVLPVKIGRVVVKEGVPLDLIKDAIKNLK